MFHCFLKKLDYYHSQDLDEMNIIEIYLNFVCDGDPPKDTIQDKLYDFLNEQIESLDTEERLELLEEESWEYDPYEAIFEMKEEYGLNWVTSKEQLKDASIQFYLEREIKENLFDDAGWVCELEDALAERFDKLKELWREKRIIKRNKLVDKLPIHCVSHLVISYL